MAYEHPPRRTEVREARFHKFEQEFAAYEVTVQQQQAQDRLLDAYSIWMRHRSPVTAENLSPGGGLSFTMSISSRLRPGYGAVMGHLMIYERPLNHSTTSVPVLWGAGRHE